MVTVILNCDNSRIAINVPEDGSKQEVGISGFHKVEVESVRTDNKELITTNKTLAIVRDVDNDIMTLWVW